MKSKHLQIPPEQPGGGFNVFLSHSGTLSQTLAAKFGEFLGVVLSLEPFFSDESIRLGGLWSPELEVTLAQADIGLFFLTRSNAHTSSWMFYEAGAIAAIKGKESRVIPVLIDIETSELPDVYRKFQAMRFTKENCWKLVMLLSEKNKNDRPIPPQHLEQRFLPAWQTLCELWETALLAEKQEEARCALEAEFADKTKQLLFDKIAQDPTGVHFSDDTFYYWTYALHNVIHIAREICVLMMADHQRNDNELPDAIKPDLAPPSHPGMERFRIRIHVMLDNIRLLFEKLPETSGCNIRVCLRDLRSDDHFHTFARSAPNPRPLDADYKSTPLHKDCLAFQELEATWSQAKCVVETSPQKGWNSEPGTHPNDAFYGTQSVLIGSVIAKEVKEDIISNAYMIWALFVSSDKAGVFRPYHRAILQGCNDAFSCMANLMLRRDGCSPTIQSRE